MAYEVHENFDAGLTGSPVTPDNTIFHSVSENGAAGTTQFVAGGRSGQAISRTNSSGFGMLGFPLPGATFEPPSTVVQTLADPLGGTLVASCWYKIDTPGTGFGLALFYLETANVVQWETEGDGVYRDYEAISISFAPAGYAGYGGDAGDNLWILQRTPQFTGAGDEPNIDTYGAVPVGEWLKYEMSYQEDGTSRVTVANAAGATLVDTGWQAGPAGWRPSATWNRVRNFANTTGSAQYTLDDYSLRIVLPVIEGRSGDVRRRFVRAASL